MSSPEKRPDQRTKFDKPRSRKPGAAHNKELWIRAWRRWQDRRLADKKWLPLQLLARYWVRKHHSSLPSEDAELEAWQIIYDSIFIGEFDLNQKTEILWIGYNHTCSWITREILRALPEFPKNTSLDGSIQAHADLFIKLYLSACWVPYDIAANWLSTFGIDLSETLPLGKHLSDSNQKPITAVANNDTYLNWMITYAEDYLKKYGKKCKRNDTIKACMDANNVTSRAARDLWKQIPSELKNRPRK